MEQWDAGEYPHLAELAREHIMRPGYDFGDEFEFGLDAVLDALARLVPGEPLTTREGRDHMGKTTFQ
jgi:hypothetical protein